MSEEIREMDKAYAEKKAAALVEKKCENCVYNGTHHNCDECCYNWHVHCPDFTPTRHAINLEIEELLNQTAIKQESASNIDEKSEPESNGSNKNLMYSANYNSYEMLSLLEECLSIIAKLCREACGVRLTPDAICECDTYELKKKIKATIKKAKGE